MRMNDNYSDELYELNAVCSVSDAIIHANIHSEYVYQAYLSSSKSNQNVANSAANE